MYDFKVVEKDILDFWKKNKIYPEKFKREGKRKFYYLDGPPYTSGKIHVGHAWGKALRDTIMRYKRMQGFDIWDRAGFDMHGLPIEHRVEAKLGIRDKEEIEKFGIKKYIEECENLAIENMRIMIDDFTKMGVWMNFNDPYMSVRNEYIEGVWWLVKKAHEKRRLYRGLRTIHWCGSCETAVAKHELEYQNISDRSIYVKFKVKNKKNEYFIIWTTTPWTILFNLAIMVNPKLNYVKVKKDNEIWIIAKDLVKEIEEIANSKLKIIEEFKGKTLKGLKYEYPLKEYIDFFKQDIPKLHTIVLSEEYVNTESGTGLVHCAPGCGPEDYEVGYKNKLPPYNTLKENGTFDDTIPKFKGLKAREDDNKILNELDKKRALIADKLISHEYPFCWRCHNPVLFRTTKQWFFKIEDLKKKMRELNKNILWVPDWAGSRQFDSWLDNLRDNSISKQRYWGTPLPIWKCDKCENYIVIGSSKDLKKYVKKIPDNLHKPWIDDVEWKCKCKGMYKRIPDVIDVWVDAGSASWLCLDYPKKRDLFKKYYPADFILEGKDQIRGWFNLLFVASMIALNRPSFKAVYMHGFINDQKGRKMSKSEGNIIEPDEVLDKYGADVMRYYMVGGTSAGVDLNYNFKDMEVKFRNLSILYNTYKFLMESCRVYNIKPRLKSGLDLEEEYILSKKNSIIKEVTKLFDEYRLDEIPWEIERLFLELSRFYIQIIREKLVLGDKELVLGVIYDVFLDCLKIFAPIAPFITEKIYQDLRERFKLKEESIHLCKWPRVNEKKINKRLENEVEEIKKILQEILALREKVRLGIRWPLKQVEISNEKTLKRFNDIIKRQVNVKEVIWKKGKFNVKLDTKLTKELEEEGFTREIIRRIQDLRKKAKLRKDNLIELSIGSNYNLSKFKEEIMNKVGAKILDFEDKNYSEKSIERIKDIEFRISFEILK